MNKKSLFALLAVVGFSLSGWGADQPDSRVRTIVSPTRLVAASEGLRGTSVLCGPRFGQVSEGTFLKGSGPILGKGQWVMLDFGRELHGSVQIGSGGRSGRAAKIRIRLGESVSEAMSELGERGACNDHAVRDDVIALPWYGRREFGESGFRFVRIDNVGTDPVQLEYVRAVSLMRPMKPIGSFRSSDERLNQVFSTAVHTVHLCCQDFLWDGIKRDRLVWMGDTHPETMSILAVFGKASVLPRILKTVKPDGTQTWGGFLDWPTQHNAEACKEGTCGLLATTLGDAAEMLRVTGDAELAAQCEAAVKLLKGRKPDPCGSKQAAALLALGGLREPKEMFAEVLGKGGVAGVSTFYGYYMLEAMSAAGEDQRALDTVRDYWGAMLDMGATSFWEDFNVAWTNNAFRIDQLPVAGKKDIHGDYGEFCYVGFRHSLCHGWSSGPAAWLINHVLGARVTGEGGTEVEVKPFLGTLAWAEGALATAKGPVKIRVDKASDGTLKVKVDAPKGVRVRRCP